MDGNSRIPEWSKGARLKAALRRQRCINPDDIFKNSSHQSCDLQKIFGSRQHRPRSSSSNWMHDGHNLHDKNAYQKKMGFTSNHR
jgi:hypothetical protein